ncbi:lysozyme-like domain-containing protein [Mucor mucedo]|uniref:lysozyme-like domain-containing protein n=1 Tax=Mucor mucedo TaxID=29922 RepID=UPI0022200C18|nr:lysozyme-like domain-containing protein [Mucor mucedo]KAI7887975.1 lysozyme-like domain-containing protein [Mucor mucedo]
MKSVYLLLLCFGLPFVLASSYCTGSFKPTTSICKKFQFNKLKSAGHCTDSKKKTSGAFKGLKLSNCTTFYDISKLPNQSMDAHSTKMAELITNVFENGNTKMGYAAIEKLGDCRGYTGGYIGFTTGTNDAYAVVKEYVKRSPKSNLKKFLPELKRLTTFLFGDPKRDDVSRLAGFPKAWKSATCNDPVFIQTQLDVGEAMYMKPALKYAASVGVKSNLGKAIFYDTIVQHGWQYVEPSINLPRILLLTGKRKTNESEKSYLTRFLTTRRQLMCCYPGDVWNSSADRVADLQSLVNQWSKNQKLSKPVQLKIYGATVTGKENLLVDKQTCKNVTSKKAKSIPLPIPNTCPKK